MHPANMGDFRLVEVLGNGLIRQQHELFNQLMRLIVFNHDRAISPAIFITINLNFLHLEVERSSAEAFGAKNFSDFPQRLNHCP